MLIPAQALREVKTLLRGTSAVGRQQSSRGVLRVKDARALSIVGSLSPQFKLNG